ncbi:MAG: type II secretion system protein [Candidatus Riflebacteria bacterium]|nr:type II secretion system protein [Candidatus Riflebacteria bacterium]
MFRKKINLFPVNRTKVFIGTSTGFTLIEALIVILLLGIASAGMFQMLDLSRTRYDSTVSRQWQTIEIAQLYRKFRSLISSGKLPDSGFIENLNSNNLKVKIASFTIKNFDDSSFFVKLIIFDDKNKDGKFQESEKLDLPIWFFRNKCEK